MCECLFYYYYYYCKIWVLLPEINSYLLTYYMWMCQSVITKCEDVIDQMDNPVRALALATTYSLKDELRESFRGKVMDMNGDRLISHYDFSHLPSAIQNAIYRYLAERGGDFERGWDILFQDCINRDGHNFSHLQHRHTDSIYIRGSKTRTC